MTTHRHRPEGSHESIQEHNSNEGRVTFHMNESGEVKTGSDSWAQIGVMSKGKVRKLIHDFIRGTAEHWVEAADVAEAIETFVDEKLSTIVERLLADKIERVADDVLNDLLRARLESMLEDRYRFDVDVKVGGRS